MQQQFEAGNVPGPLHLSIGQEAVAAGVCAGLRQSDVITSTHRGHHHCLAKGANVERMMAELFGRQGGYGHGRGGSMHLADTEIGLLGTNGIVGGGLPIAAGAALGMQVQHRDDVAVCFFGEGAAATGNFGEAMNIASLWQLPVVFVCENNRYAELTPSSVHVAGEIYERAEGYGMPGVRIDGNDVNAVSEATDAAIARARAGEGPTLIEALTYRWFGHYAGDKASYRDIEEVEHGRSQDALDLARASLDGKEADAIDAEVEQVLTLALEQALADEFATPEGVTL